MISAAKLSEKCRENIRAHEGAEGLVVALMDNSSGTPFLGKIDGARDFVHMRLEFEQIVPVSVRQAAADFQRTVLTHIQKQASVGRSVVVFCEDGFNLTGYCIVSFLRQVFKMPLETALQAFAEARPPGIFHAPYLDDLHALYGSADAKSPPPIPNWAAEVSRYLDKRPRPCKQYRAAYTGARCNPTNGPRIHAKLHTLGHARTGWA
jgi:hypothetical protein